MYYLHINYFFILRVQRSIRINPSCPVRIIGDALRNSVQSSQRRERRGSRMQARPHPHRELILASKVLRESRRAMRNISDRYFVIVRRPYVIIIVREPGLDYIRARGDEEIASSTGSVKVSIIV